MPENDQRSRNEDYPLLEVPLSDRKSIWSISAVLLGFTFFTATMWGGGRLGVAFSIFDLLWILILGNFLLGSYVALLSFIAFKSGLNSVLMARYAFGDWGSKWVDVILGFTQIGWYAWGTSTIAVLFTEMLHFNGRFNNLLIIIFGFSFCWTAYIGYKGLEKLSAVAVPSMVLLIALSLFIAYRDIGGIEGLLLISPTEKLSIGEAITIVFGTFVSGGTHATNWTRFSKTARTAVYSSFFAFFLGNGLMIFAGAFGAYVYQEPDIVSVLALQGLLLSGIIMLFLNIWTTQDNTVYNFSVAGCNLLRSSNRRFFTIVGASIGTLLAILGIYKVLIPFIIILGIFIPPIGGTIFADFFLKHRCKYSKLGNSRIIRFNWNGIISYLFGSAIAYYAGGIAPVNGIISSFAIYAMIYLLSNFLYKYRN